MNNNITLRMNLSHLNSKQLNKRYLIELTKEVEYTEDKDGYKTGDTRYILPFPIHGGNSILAELVSDYVEIDYVKMQNLKNCLGYAYDFAKYFNKNLDFLVRTVAGLRFTNDILKLEHKIYHILNFIDEIEFKKIFEHYINKEHHLFDEKISKVAKGLEIIKAIFNHKPMDNTYFKSFLDNGGKNFIWTSNHSKEFDFCKYSCVDETIIDKIYYAFRDIL